MHRLIHLHVQMPRDWFVPLRWFLSSTSVQLSQSNSRYALSEEAKVARIEDRKTHSDFSPNLLVVSRDRCRRLCVVAPGDEKSVKHLAKDGDGFGATVW